MIFDLDGTLTKERSSWYFLARHFGSYATSRQNMSAYKEGEIDYAEFMRRDIVAWGDRIPVTLVKSLLDQITLRSSAIKAVSEIGKQRNCAIVTTAPGLLAERVANDLGIATVRCNQLLSDAEGILTGQTIFNVDLLKKDKTVQDVVELFGHKMRDCAAVGDSIFDLSTLRIAGLGVAIEPDEELSKQNLVTIADLDELLVLLDSN